VLVKEHARTQTEQELKKSQPKNAMVAPLEVSINTLLPSIVKSCPVLTDLDLECGDRLSVNEAGLASLSILTTLKSLKLAGNSDVTDAGIQRLLGQEIVPEEAVPQTASEPAESERRDRPGTTDNTDSIPTKVPSVGTKQPRSFVSSLTNLDLTWCSAITDASLIRWFLGLVRKKG